MSKMRDLEQAGLTITLHCAAKVALCSHSWEPTWEQLIQYLGEDFDFGGDRKLMQLFVCEKCGGRGATVIVQPRHDPKTMGVGGWRHAEPSAEVMEHLARENARTRAAMDAHIAEGARVRQQRAAERKTRKAIESGRDPIGPPNPRKPWRR